ncbi:cold-shock protein, partial [Sinorhizobium meliloti]
MRPLAVPGIDRYCEGCSATNED